MIFQCCELVSFSFILPVLPILMRYSEWSCKRVYSKPTVLTLKHFRKNSPPYVHVFGPGTASLEISVVKIHPLTCTYSVQERVIRNKCRERGRMYVEISYGDGLFTLVNINVTNNILLSHLKSSASAEMIEQLKEKQALAEASISDYSADLQRTEKIHGVAETPEEDSAAVKLLKGKIETWKHFLETSVNPYVQILNTRRIIVDVELDGSPCNLSKKAKEYAKNTLSPKQSLRLVYKVAVEDDWKQLAYVLNDPNESAMSPTNEDGAAEGA